MLFRRHQGWLHYDLIGSAASPVVCMTHSLTSDGGMWAEQVGALLAGGYQVLRLDMRGHGGSTPFEGAYTIEELAADVIAILDFLGFDKVHLIGLSMGGMIGQVIAADHPRLLRSLMACATSSQWVGDATFMRDRMDLVQSTGSLAEIVDQNMERRYSDNFRLRCPERWVALRQTFLGTSIAGYIGCMEAILKHNVSGRLNGITTPTLVVAGADDLATPPEANQDIARNIPGAEYAEIAGGRHFLNVEFETEFNHIMMAWLGRHDESK